MLRFKNRRRARQGKFVMFVGLLLLFTTLFLFNQFNKADNLLLPLAEQSFKDKVTQKVYEGLSDADLGDTVIIKYDSKGRISSLSTDTAALNKLASELLKYLDRELGEADIEIEIPVGELVGDSLSVGDGLSILLGLSQYKSTYAEFYSEFVSSGINQTVLRVTLNISAETKVLLPGLKTEKLVLDLSIPVSATVIVGEVPDTYIDSSKYD